jgi:hypothetical protein
MKLAQRIDGLLFQIGEEIAKPCIALIGLLILSTPFLVGVTIAFALGIAVARWLDFWLAGIGAAVAIFFLMQRYIFTKFIGPAVSRLSDELGLQPNIATDPLSVMTALVSRQKNLLAELYMVTSDLERIQREVSEIKASGNEKELEILRKASETDKGLLVVLGRILEETKNPNWKIRDSASD